MKLAFICSNAFLNVLLRLVGRGTQSKGIYRKEDNREESRMRKEAFNGAVRRTPHAIEVH